VATLGGVPRGRSNLETGGTHQESPLERKLETLRGPLVEKLAHILKGKEINIIIPKVMILKKFKKSKPPSFDGEVKKGKEAEASMLSLKKYFRDHDYFENSKA
jgi:hypothetical protein